ncbi:MAG: glycosyltransferase [Pseudomonadota bacterium]|nr:glycosyltransferase [Pseudomonadota bacterium]
MKFVLFYHSLVSDWNHGNAHFLRGIVSELLARGHKVEVLEPEDGWSRAQMLAEHGPSAMSDFERRFPRLRSTVYRLDDICLEETLDDADVVLVHEWNDPALVARLGRLTAPGRTLLFHDTHHRSATAPREMARFDLSGYDGVLAFGEAVRQKYLEHDWCDRAWTWHEAADIRVFFPHEAGGCDGDVVWIGNWGDDERSRELSEFLIDPVRQLDLRARIHGVRYPPEALAKLEASGIAYRGWLPNHRVPEVFARFLATVHVPRRPYVQALPGIPTIRMFEALACGIPLVSAPWPDSESLFTPGRDYLVAADGRQMRDHLRDLLHDRPYAEGIARHGLRTILSRHTCGHRVEQLLTILDELTRANLPTTRSVDQCLSH